MGHSPALQSPQNGVASIGLYAFNGCTALASLVVPSGVATIKANAFDGDTSLASVSLPATLSSLGDYAFQSDSSLTSVLMVGSTPPALNSGTNLISSAKVGLLVHVPSGSLTVYQSAAGWIQIAAQIVSP